MSEALLRHTGRTIVLAFLAVVVVTPAAAQAPPPPGANRGWENVALFEQWRVGSGSSEDVRSARQLSVPMAVAMPLGGSVLLDAYAAWTSGEVTVGDGEGGERSYTLSGVSDVKVRATIRLAGDGVLLTMGVGAPTGATRLDAEEYAALRVLAAPGLRFYPPGIGTGLSATSGLVVTRRTGNWALGLGASYEYRGDYAPLDAAAAGLTTLELDPGNAMRISAGADGLIGSSAMSLTASATFHGRDRVTSDAGETMLQFGPAIMLDWRLRTVVPGFDDVALYVYDRYRSGLRDETGTMFPGSAGNELEAGIRGAIRLGRRVALTTALDGRHHTGQKVNEALATAAMYGGSATLGLSISTAGLTFQPFIRGQAGRMQSGDDQFGITGFAGGLGIRTRF